MNKQSYIRESKRLPKKVPCIIGEEDKDITCENKNLCTRKFGELNCVKSENVKLKDRLVCNKDEELIYDYCYKKCKPGYVSDGMKCKKGLSTRIKKKISLGNNSLWMRTRSFLLKNKTIINYILYFIIILVVVYSLLSVKPKILLN